MSVSIKSAREIELMREAGRLLANVHEELGKALKPGMTTKTTKLITSHNTRRVFSPFTNNSICVN